MENLNKDLLFLSSYWLKLNEIADRIRKELPIVESIKKPIEGFKHIKTVQFSDLNDSWLVNGEKSATLEALADKICFMMNKGRSNDIQPMVSSIANNSIKKLTKPAYITNRGEFLGYGHFRWDFRAYTLNEIEIKKVKDFFEIV